MSKVKYKTKLKAVKEKTDVVWKRICIRLQKLFRSGENGIIYPEYSKNKTINQEYYTWQSCPSKMKER